MRKIIYALIVIIVGVWCGLKIHADPGYVLMAYQHWTVQMPLWALFAICLIVYAILSLGIGFFRRTYAISSYLSAWTRRRRQRRARNKTGSGLLAFAEGRWQQAEKHLIKAAARSELPLINYLAAAMSAQKQEADSRRDEYLQLAYQAMPEAEVAIGLTQAQLQLADKQYEQALATLRHLQQLAPHHAYVLSLLKHLYEKLGDYDSLLTLLPRLLDQDVISKADKESLMIEIYTHQLQVALEEKNLTAIKEKWRNMPKAYQRQGKLVVAYTRALLTYHEDEQALSIIQAALKTQWDSTLVLLFAQCQIKDVASQLRIAEGWLKRHPNDAYLNYSLAKIGSRLQRWDEVKQYLQKSIDIKPMALSYQLLAECFEQAGDLKQAVDAYKCFIKLTRVS